MLRHVALFRFRDGVDEAAVAELHDALVMLPEVVPELEELICGPDVGLREGNADYGLIAVFEDADGWRAYQEHPEHRRIISDLLEPLLGERTAAQF